MRLQRAQSRRKAVGRKGGRPEALGEDLSQQRSAVRGSSQPKLAVAALTPARNGAGLLLSISFVAQWPQLEPLA